MSRTAYNEVIGYTPDGDVIILHDTFDHGNGFRGATGSILELISQERYDQDTSDEALEEQAEELWRQDAGSTNGTTKSLEEWAEEAHDDLVELVYDSSYSAYVPDGDHVATNCIAAGRIFPDALSDATIIRPDLVAVINEAEGVSA